MEPFLPERWEHQHFALKRNRPRPVVDSLAILADDQLGFGADHEDAHRQGSKVRIRPTD
jgi:hypothetical protein